MAYAWSRFALETNEWGRIVKWAEVGDEVSQSDLGVDDDEWNELYAVGVLSDEPYPDIPSHMSPAEYWRAHPDESPGSKVEPAKTEEGNKAATTPASSTTPAFLAKKEEGGKK